jgi:hypothetical protein
MNDSSLWRQAFDQRAILSHAFSLCFSRQSIASREGTGAGVMTLGGPSDTRLHTTNMVYAQQDNSNGWFKVHIRAVYLRRGGGTSVQPTIDTSNTTRWIPVQGISENNLNNGDVIVDSGTTDTYLSVLLASPFREAYKTIMDGVDWDPDTPVTLSDRKLLDMPTILIQLQGWEFGDNDPMAEGMAGSIDGNHPNDIIVAVPPTHYMEYSVKTKKYSPRIYFSEYSGGVLGANFMMGHDIFFDAEKHRLGFAESDCDYETVSQLEESG